MGAATSGRPHRGDHMGVAEWGWPHRGGHIGTATWEQFCSPLKMNIVPQLDLMAAGGARRVRGQVGQGDGHGQAAERPPDGLMPPRNKRRWLTLRQQMAL
eukprot:COSAG06_NODE_50356_length_319_cov_0.845455_1_plen_99_part_10